MFIAEKLHKPLFELRPDLFPDGYLDEVEHQLWVYHTNYVHELNEQERLRHKSQR